MLQNKLTRQDNAFKIRKDFDGLVLSRRAILGSAALLAATGGSLRAAEPSTDFKRPSPIEALAILKRGNANFLQGKPVPTDANGQRRLAIARTQQPFAILVSCSDSRVPPEVLFGRGLGELFIVRNAGNTVDTAACPPSAPMAQT